MKVRFGRATIKRTEDTEIPDDAFDFAFMGAGDDDAQIVYMLPADVDSALKSRVTEILHHLEGGYK